MRHRTLVVGQADEDGGGTLSAAEIGAHRAFQESNLAGALRLDSPRILTSSIHGATDFDSLETRA